MALEATLDDLATLPAADAIGRFVEHNADTVQAIATALREQRPLDTLPNLRAMQRELVTSMRGSSDRATLELLARISDRLVDNIDTLAYVLKRTHPEPSA